MTFTIFVQFQGKKLTLDSTSYPKFGCQTTVGIFRNMVRQHCEIIKSDINVQKIHISFCGKILLRDCVKISDYGLSNMSTCFAYVYIYNAVTSMLLNRKLEELIDMINSCKNNWYRKNILLTRKFQIDTIDWMSFWEQVLAKKLCSLMAPCVRLGMPVNEKYDSTSALCIALYNDQVKLVRELLLLDADPNIKSRFLMDEKLKTPLQSVPIGVSRKRFSESRGLTYLKLLIDFKADRTVASPLFSSVRGGQLRIASYLIDEGCNVDARDSLNETPLMIAIFSGDINLTRVLHGVYGASPNIRIPNLGNCTPFMQAVSENRRPIVEYFLFNHREKRKALELALWELCRFNEIIFDLIWRMIQVPKVDLSLTDDDHRSVFDMANSDAVLELLHRSLNYM